MDIRVLEVSLGKTQCGHLFLYGKGAAFETLRFVPSESYVLAPDRPTLSLAFTSPNEEATRLLLRDVTAREFNGYKNPRGQDTFLPAWFQNLLPEGAFLRHIAQLRNCPADDHFEILAACGKDLPGAVTVQPAKYDAGLLQKLVTQGQDALEMSVIDLPMHEGFSLSGVQPKLSVNEKDGRYVARTRMDSTTRIIAKLPAVGFPRMPEVEHTSMRLARMAGADVCETKLVPLSALEAEHDYDLGDPDPETTMFLAVTRYDREGAKRIHAEDFAQIFSVMPDNKYSKEYSYAQMMGLMLTEPSLGEEAVYELVRRLTVNELLGNADAHLKNIGIYYPQGNAPVLPPAYDVVSQYALNNSYGHALFLLPEALSKEQLELQKKKLPESRMLYLARPSTIKALCQFLNIPGKEKRMWAEVGAVVKKAAELWPAAIDESPLTSGQKKKMRAILEAHPAVAAIRAKDARAGKPSQP